MPGQRKLIEVGDIILIEKGMKVRADIQEKFVNPRSPYSSKVVHATIEIGKVYENKPFSREEVARKMQKILFEQFGVGISENTAISLIVNYLNINYQIQKFDTSIYEGEYVVKSAGYYTSKLIRGPFPVQCYKKDDPSMLVDFYVDSPYIPSESI